MGGTWNGMPGATTSEEDIYRPTSGTTSREGGETVDPRGIRQGVGQGLLGTSKGPFGGAGR